MVDVLTCYCVAIRQDLHDFVCCVQKFAEKPKGKELDAMKVDTTVLGQALLCLVVQHR